MRLSLWTAPLLLFEVAATRFGNFPRQTASLPTAVPSPPVTSPTQGLLVPSIYDTDLTDLQNLDPQTDLQVYYEEGGEGTHAAFVAFTDLKHPTVVLEHSSYIINVTCSNEVITLDFSDSSVASYALEAWSEAITEGIIFITNCASCSYGYPAERGWLLVSEIRQEGDLSISCYFTEVLASEVTKTVAVTFGQVSQGGNPAKSKRSSEYLKSSQFSKRKCSSDNCLNAIANGGSTGASFCSSFMATTQTETTSTSTSLGLFASKCSNLPSRISSACSCLTTNPAASSSSSIILNLAESSTRPSSSIKTSSSTLVGKLTSSSSLKASMVTGSSSKLTTSTKPIISTSSQKSTTSSQSTILASSKVSTLTNPSTGSSKVSTSTSKSLSSVSSTKSASTDSTRSSTHISSLSSSKLSSSSSSKSSSVVSSRSSVFVSSLSSTKPQSSSSSIKSVTSVSSSKSQSSSSSKIPSSVSTGKPPSSSSSSKTSSSISSAKSTTSTKQSVSSSSSKSSSQTGVSTVKPTSSAQTTTPPQSTTPKLLSSITSLVKVPSTSSTKGTSSTNSQTTTSSAASTSAPPTIQDFDTTLDNALGYLNSSEAGFWNQLLPGVPASDLPGFGSFRVRARTWNLANIGNALESAVSAVAGAALNPADAVYSVASDAISGAVATVQVLNSLSPFSLGPFPFSAGPKPTASSDFGPGIILTQSSGKSSQGLAGTLTTYCIGCVTTGSFSVTGSVIFDAQEGITSAIFDLAGNIQAQIELALVASVAASASQQQNIITQGLPALTVPGFLVLGPAISLDVGATVAIQAVGGLAAGYQFAWPSITAHFDILDDIYNVAGFTPVATPIFDYEGKVSAQASLYGLVSLTFGIDIMKGTYKANVGLVDKPEVDSTIAIQVYSDYQLSQLADGTVICAGEQFTISAKDSVYADVVYGGIANKNSTKTWPLTSWAGPTFTTCFGSLSTVHHTNSSSSTSTTTTPATTTHTYPSATPSLPGIGSCDPVAADTKFTWHACIHIPDPSDSTAVANFIYNMGFEGGPAGEDEAVNCREEMNTGTDELACWARVQALIPAAINETNPCPAIQNGSSTQANLEAVICQGEINYWREFQTNLNWIIDNSPLKPRGLSGDLVEREAVSDEESLQKRLLGVTISTAGDIFNSSTHLAWSADGNVVASVNGTRFISVGGYFFGDGDARFLHLYQDELTVLGVSRLRLASLDMMPVGSVLVSLTPLALPSTAPHSVLVAFTSAGNMYYLVTCIIEGQLPKVFIVQDPVAGITVLMNPAQQSTITGGVVDMCGLLRWGH